MKQIFKLTLLLLALLLPATATAYDFEVDGICYYFTGDNQVGVADPDGYPDVSDYSGSVTIPETVTYNGTTYSVTSIDDYVFGCSSRLTSITIPNSITSIGDGAFSFCTGLTSITIPNSVTTIGSGAFYYCLGLTDLIWNARNCISNGAMETSIIERVTIGDEVEVLPNYFVSGSKITSVTIPNSVTTIGSSAFSGCSGLTGELTIPNSVTTIGSSAFYYCSGLTSISIPESVTSIGKQAFYNDPIIEKVTCAATTPPAWNDISLFSSNVYYHTPLYVPTGKERAYMTDQSWGQFLHIIGIQDEVIATSIAVSQPQMSLLVRGTSQLVAIVLPDSTTNKRVIWASNDPTVAIVDATGMVTAVAPGSATITATTTDGSNLSALCTVTVNEDITDFDNYLSMSDTTAFHNEAIVIPVRLTNTQEIFAFQTDFYLPEDFTIVTDEDDEYIITPSSRLTSDHILMTSDYTSGTIRVICYTPNSLPISGNDGDLFYVTVMVPNDAEGDYTIRLQNVLLTTTNFNEVAAPNVESVVHVNTYMPGDANNSHTVNVTDIVVAAQYVLGLNPSPFIFEAADMNGDGNVTVTDIMLIAYLINHPAMNAPRRMPALMNSSDRMSGEGVTLMPGETRTLSIALDNEMLYTAFQLDLTLLDGLTASNFQLTDRAGSHVFDVSTLSNSKTRALCYSPAIEAIDGNSGALLTFDVTAAIAIEGDILVDGIELVTADCQSVLLNGFAIGVNTATSVNEVAGSKTVARVDYFNLAGQRLDRPDSGVTLIVTTYTDGTRTITKVIK